MRSIVLIIFAILCCGTAKAQCEDLAEKATGAWGCVQYTKCLFEPEDMKLNIIYQELMRDAPEKLKDLIKKEQRIWVDTKYTMAIHVWDPAGGGTMGHCVRGFVVTNMTIDRTKYLEGLYYQVWYAKLGFENDTSKEAFDTYLNSIYK